MATLDKQQGWNDALEIILFRFFTDVAWQEGLGQERKRVAADMEEWVKHKKQDKSLDSQKAMDAIVLPFCEMLMGKSHPESPFSIKWLAAEKQARDDALEIILEKFMFFSRHKLQLGWKRSDIAEDMKNLVGHKGIEKCQTYRQAICDVVRPFYMMLKGKPQQKHPFDT